jgi:glycosyltransferase involved in cell wall biosynthesis
MKPFSVIIPAYNEGETIFKTISSLKDFLSANYELFEIIVVNDGSTDNTREILNQISGIRILNHKYNKGYGASLKTGIKKAVYNWLLFYDADGQFRAEEIKKLTDACEGYDMVIGARISKKAPWIRSPGRKILHFLANYLSDKEIPDLNSGFRLVKKDKLLEFWHLFPNSFSFSTTLTLAFYRNCLDIMHVPVNINERTGGKSLVKPRHAIKMFFLILKTIALFSPLRVFLPVFVIFALTGLGFLIYDLIHKNIGDSSVFLFIAAIIVLLFALLADQIVAIRQELQRRK